MTSRWLVILLAGVITTMACEKDGHAPPRSTEAAFGDPTAPSRNAWMGISMIVYEGHVYVQEIVGCPAFRAGLQAGDKLLGWRKPASSWNDFLVMDDVSGMVQKQAGSMIDLRVERERRVVTIRVVLNWPRPADPMSEEHRANIASCLRGTECYCDRGHS